MSILVVGSVALDSVETPFGKVEDVVGGTAIYFSAVASVYSPVKLVGVVGDDFPREQVEFLRERGVDLAGLQSVPGGRTFRWKGFYDFDLNTAHTLDTQLNVFAGFAPELPEDYRRTPFVFLGNIHPQLQLDVLEQVEDPGLVVLDTMNYWITGEKELLTEVIRRVDIVVVNEAEARQYAGSNSLFVAAREILGLGPRALIVKKGEYGCVLFTSSSYFAVPGYPLEEVKDPTGAGDSFAGGFLGYLATREEVDDLAIRQAIVHGCVAGSFAVQDFSIGRMRRLTQAEIRERYRDF
jgi:sugar/nucleoside kinase (ribokinase family)